MFHIMVSEINADYMQVCVRTNKPDEAGEMVCSGDILDFHERGLGVVVGVGIMAYMIVYANTLELVALCEAKHGRIIGHFTKDAKILHDTKLGRWQVAMAL